uniref:Uncharacterized protein n=1 Tax=Amphimedon queenslandica TaxID=400682 RepID=A0A1X7VJN4_AMPQE
MCFINYKAIKEEILGWGLLLKRKGRVTIKIRMIHKLHKLELRKIIYLKYYSVK